MKGFEVVKKEPEAVTSNPQSNNGKEVEQPQKFGTVLADNFDSIIKLASDLVEIKKMKVQSEAILKKMAEDRKTLLAEAEAYAIRKNADTNDVVQKMAIIRGMMQDFYAQSNQQISGEDFRIIITEIVEQMGKVENGSR